MSAELVVDLSQCLVALPGEEVACPDCLASLARVVRPWTAADFEKEVVAREVLSLLEAGLLKKNPPSGHVTLWCRLCGGAPTRPFKDHEGQQFVDGSGPRIFFRRGAKFFWREMGGE